MTIKNATLIGTIGVLLNIFGILGTIFISINRVYTYGFFLTIPAIIIGVILIAWIFSD